MKQTPLKTARLSSPAVMRLLAACGTAQNRKIYQRHGSGPNVFGVSFAHLGKLQKRIRTDHDLALELWKTGNADARNLALLIVEPTQMTSVLTDRWAKDLDQFLSYTFAQMLARTPLASKKAQAWRDSPSEWKSCVAWLLIAQLAMNDAELPDASFRLHLNVIKDQIHRRPNWVRHAMNSALIAVGVRNPALRTRAFEVARHIGKIEVDHGQTGCKTPDAAAYIKKTSARRRQRPQVSKKKGR